MPTSNQNFRLQFRFGLFPLRLFFFALVGLLVTSLSTNITPSINAFVLIFGMTLLISITLWAIKGLFPRLSLAFGMTLTWTIGIALCALVYFLLPLINTSLVPLASLLPTWIGSPSISPDEADGYLIILALLVLPLALAIEQLRHVSNVLESEQESTEVKDLDMRIRPHFLFNSLNSVAGLIHIDPDTAELGLMDLADMFRIIMTDKRKNVPISAELDMARKYVSLEKIRLGKRLKVQWELKDLDKSINLPILTLQPLIENAIYHGIETRLKGGVISIKARSTTDHLFISIINPRPDTNAPVRKGNQVAQANLRDRIEIAYGGEGSINLMETENFYTVTLKVPRTISIH